MITGGASRLGFPSQTEMILDVDHELGVSEIAEWLKTSRQYVVGGFRVPDEHNRV